MGRISKLTGRDDFIKAKLEEGYSFRLLSRELGVSYQTLINYVKGLDSHYYRKKQAGIGFRKPLTPRNLAERYNVPTYVIRDWLRQGRIAGKKIGYRWIIVPSSIYYPEEGFED